MRWGQEGSILRQLYIPIRAQTEQGSWLFNSQESHTGLDNVYITSGLVKPLTKEENKRRGQKAS
jgi:hypothetical protein